MRRVATRFRVIFDSALRLNHLGDCGFFGGLTRRKKQRLYSSHMTAQVKKRLEEIRHAILNLHKSLVDSERVTYETTVGAIRSPSQFLQLLTTDPWFAWLQPLSQLIVSMDEALDSKEPVTDAAVNSTIKEANVLLSPSENGEGFSRHYFDAIQRDPDVVIAHAEVMKLFGRKT